MEKKNTFVELIYYILTGFHLRPVIHFKVFFYLFKQVEVI